MIRATALGQSSPLIQAKVESFVPWDERRKQRNESTTYHAAILGNIGVKTSCVMKNQTMPIVLPAMPP